MTTRPDQIKLGLLIDPVGHHVAAWRHPLASDGTALHEYVKMAQLAEAARFDLLFLADVASAKLKNIEAASRKSHNSIYPFEPITLLSALAMVTRHVGLVATASTSFNEPYNVARMFASLNRLSDGRAGWNLVTTAEASAALNYGGASEIRHADRYGRAGEFADAVRLLWDSWAPDAFLRDRDSGVYFDPSKLYPTNHSGKHFRIQGPLNIMPSTHGHPLITQAGASDAGRELAARTADVVFSAQLSADDAVQFYSDLKGRMSRHGRALEDLKIMAGLFPVTAPTQAEAEDKFEQLQRLIDPVVGLDLLSNMSGGLDLGQFDLDGPVPEVPETNANKSNQKRLLDLARRENLSIRELYLRISGARGHWQIVGTPAQIADRLQERFEMRGADGFIVMPPVMPQGLSDFVELIVPELRRRGLFRTRYEGANPRENLGLGGQI